MIKSLFISYDGMTDPLGQSQVIPYLQGLSEAGYQITILSCEKRENYKKNKDLILKLLTESNIKWEFIMYRKNPPVISTILDVLELKKKAINLQKKESFDIVHCRSYISSLIGLHMKRKFNTKFLFDMRGFWADERVDGNLWNLSNPVYRIVYNYFKKKEAQFLENADGIVSLTEAGKNEIFNWKENYKNELDISIIPCCADINLFDKDNVDVNSKQELKSKLGIGESEFVLSYLGSIGTWYLLEEMLQFFNSLKEEIPNSKFLFISPSESHSKIREGIEKLKIDSNSIIIEESSRKDVPLYISLSNFSIFFIKPSYSKKSSSPTKQGEIMAMGIPIICNTGVGDTDMIVNKYNSGISVNEFSELNYKEVIRKIKNNIFDQYSIRRGAVEYFSINKGLELYSSLYSEILKK